MNSQPLKWHGGKSYLAKWIHSKAPTGYTHRNIVFAGGLGEFWNWELYEGISEAVNDCYGQLATFWQVLGDPGLRDELIKELTLTPFSEQAWQGAIALLNSNQHLSRLLLAKAFFIKYRLSRQGLGNCYATPTKRTRRGMNENVSAFLSAVDGLPECVERLRRVEIRNLDFREFLSKYDHPKALFYLDPPYLHSTRSTNGGDYTVEMTHSDHEDMLSLLVNLKGQFMLSGYHSSLYDDWATKHGITLHERRIDNKASSSHIKPVKIECLWCSSPAG